MLLGFFASASFLSISIIVGSFVSKAMASAPWEAAELFRFFVLDAGVLSSMSSSWLRSDFNKTFSVALVFVSIFTVWSPWSPSSFDVLCGFSGGLCPGPGWGDWCILSAGDISIAACRLLCRLRDFFWVPESDNLPLFGGGLLWVNNWHSLPALSFLSLPIESSPPFSCCNSRSWELICWESNDCKECRAPCWWCPQLDPLIPEDKKKIL